MRMSFFLPATPSAGACHPAAVRRQPRREARSTATTVASLLATTIAGAMAAVAVPAAAVTTYTSQAAFDAAVTGETTFGFNQGPVPSTFDELPTPYKQSGISFTDNLTAADIAMNGVAVPLLVSHVYTPNYGVDFLSFQNEQNGISADITSRGVTALGFNYGSYVVGGPAVLSVNGGLPQAIDVTGTPQFIGFSSATPITDINILFPAPNGYSFDVISVSYAGAVAGAVPEPGSWVLMIAGLGAVGFVMRQRGARVTGLRHAA